MGQGVISIFVWFFQHLGSRTEIFGPVIVSKFYFPDIFLIRYGQY